MLSHALFIDYQPEVQMKPKVSKALVSVVIPNLNRKAELVRAIQSVLDQTYKYFEIIVVDDGSYFSNQEFLKSAGIRHKGLRVLRNPVNMGLSYSRNRGISTAKGEFIAFLDSDDFWEPEKIEKQVRLLQSNPHLDMAYCDTFLHINNKKVIGNTAFYDSDFWFHLINGWQPTNPSTLIMRKTCFQKIGLFDETLRHLEDVDFWLRATDNLKVGYCTDVLSNFSFDSKDRISYTYKSKFERADVFLKKWEDKIIAKNGLVKYRKFKKELVLRMAVETFNSSFRFGRYDNLLGVFFNFLIFDKNFYRLFGRKIKSQFTKKSNGFR